MEYVFSIFMFIFAGALLLYAGLMAWQRDVKLLPLHLRPTIKPKNRKQYMVYLAKMTALCASAPLVAGLVGLLSPLAAVAVLVAGIPVAIILGRKLFSPPEDS